MTLRTSTGDSPRRGSGPRLSVLLFMTAAIVAVASLLIPAQTRFKLDRNRYTLEEDVKVGQEAAAQVTKELPLLNDRRTEEWAEEVGRGLVAAIPTEFRHAPFKYTFDVVNQKEINAFALPGGPMFLNRGMIEAGMTEAEVAGVMGHEIAHVALRHGTAQATKGERFQLGALAGQVLGAVVGGAAGSIIAQGSQFGLGTYFLKFGREYERQADLLGAQILARAGYDPRQMANMFKTIESQGGGSQPEWLSSHPNPGNRYDAILRESATLTVQGKADSGEFSSIKSRLAGMSPALTGEQIAKANASKSGGTTAGGTRTVVRVDPPSSQNRTYRPANFLAITVPSNWQPSNGSDGVVTYAPNGGVSDSGFTHGVQVGVLQNTTGDLQRDTEQMIQGFAKSNPKLQRRDAYRRESVGGRTGLTTVLSNVSDVTGEAELVTIATVQLRGNSNSVLYLIGVSPERENSTYSTTLRRVRQSLQISDR
ncbi:MAG: M48 family metalloprotease [Acidobacteria bacterium]|nr:M48 family metalloprotease [Acidobacteriota bacterium]